MSVKPLNAQVTASALLKLVEDGVVEPDFKTGFVYKRGPNGERTRIDFTDKVRRVRRISVFVDPAIYGKERVQTNAASAVWMAAFREPIPEGFRVGPKDGDATNTTLDNLTLIKSNSFNRPIVVFPDELKIQEEQQNDTEQERNAQIVKMSAMEYALEAHSRGLIQVDTRHGRVFECRPNEESYECRDEVRGGPDSAISIFVRRIPNFPMGNNSKCTVSKARLVYNVYNSTVLPDNMLIRYKDGNRANCAIDNLYTEDKRAFMNALRVDSVQKELAAKVGPAFTPIVIDASNPMVADAPVASMPGFMEEQPTSLSVMPVAPVVNQEAPPVLAKPGESRVAWRESCSECGSAVDVLVTPDWSTNTASIKKVPVLTDAEVRMRECLTRIAKNDISTTEKSNLATRCLSSLEEDFSR